MTKGEIARFVQFLLLSLCFETFQIAVCCRGVRKRLYDGKRVKQIENIVANGEIACFEQFLLLSQCVQKSFAAEASESVFMWERVNNACATDKQTCKEKI